MSATNGVNSLIRAIAVNGGDIYVAGSFTQAGGVLANNVARWNEQYNLWSPLGTGAANGVTGGASSGVNTLKISGNFVYAGGSFTQAGGAAASNIARYDLTTGVWSSLGAGAANGTNDRVNDIEVGGNEEIGNDLCVTNLFFYCDPSNATQDTLVAGCGESDIPNSVS